VRTPRPARSRYGSARQRGGCPASAAEAVGACRPLFPGIAPRHARASDHQHRRRCQGAAAAAGPQVRSPPRASGRRQGACACSPERPVGAACRRAPRWGGVVHDNKVTWLATWTENVNGNTKYVWLAANSTLKGKSDMKKYDKARELKVRLTNEPSYAGAVQALSRRAVPRSEARSRTETHRRDPARVQRGAPGPQDRDSAAGHRHVPHRQGACWPCRPTRRADSFSSSSRRAVGSAASGWGGAQLALRAGNEKDTDEEADTVGCCSLRVEHITLREPNTVIFDFLGAAPGTPTVGAW